MSYDDDRLQAQRLETQRQEQQQEQRRQLEREELNRRESQRSLESDFRRKEYANRCVNNDGPATMGGLCVACYANMKASERDTGTPTWSQTEWRAFTDALPLEKHHYASPKSDTERTDIAESIARQYGLDLEEEWNIASVRHRGRHPDQYHAFVLGTMQFIADEAKGDRARFEKLFKELVKDTVMENPEMLRRRAWWE